MAHRGSDWDLKTQEDLKNALQTILGSFDEGDTLESKVEQLRHYIRPPLGRSSGTAKRSYGRARSQRSSAHVYSQLQNLVAAAEARLGRGTGTRHDLFEGGQHMK